MLDADAFSDQYGANDSEVVQLLDELYHAVRRDPSSDLEHQEFYQILMEEIRIGNIHLDSVGQSQAEAQNRRHNGE